MAFLGCDKCGIANNRSTFQPSYRDGERVFPCPECGRPMTPVHIQEALELVRARAEAEQWRAAAATAHPDRAMSTSRAGSPH